MRRKSFTPRESLRRFVSYVVEDLSTAGQGHEPPPYYELKDGYLMNIYVKARGRSREPAAEWIFICMTILFFTLLFQCMLIDLRPTLDTELFLKIFYNVVNIILVTISLGLLIFCIKYTDG